MHHDHHHHTGSADLILDNHHQDGVDRRGFLKCMAWAGTGLVWVVGSGTLSSRVLGASTDLAMPGTPAMPSSSTGLLNFVQISDSHIGFKMPANPDVAATFRETVARINALPTTPEFLLHTGDLTHLSDPEQFDLLDQMTKDCKTKQVFYVPGEHDVGSDNGA